MHIRALRTAALVAILTAPTVLLPAAVRPARAAAVVPGQVIVQLTAEAFQEAADRPELGSRGRTGLPDLDAALAALDAFRVAPALRFPPAEGSEAGRELLRYFVVSYAADVDPLAASAQLAASPHVQVAEPNAVGTVVSAPDDPLYPSQWAHRNTVQAIPYGGGAPVGVADCDTDTELAWDHTTGSDLIIAIIDTGVDRGHPEFAGRTTAGYDFVNDDDDPADDHGHGTSCAGVVAAAGDNGQGVAGVNWSARIMAVKVIDQYGQGTIDDFASGVTWAADRGARVLSISLGWLSAGSLMEDAVIYAYGQGCAMFCAAGNGNTQSLLYPARYTDYTTAVGALSPCNERKSPNSCDHEYWWGSNYGDLCFLTPGVRMHSTDIRGAGGFDPGDYTSEFNGTSAATPHAAGIGSLVLALNPGLSPYELEYKLIRCAEDLGPVGMDPETGYGRLNAHIAVLSANTVPVFVDASFTGMQAGTLHRPFDTFGEGVAAVDPGGTVVVFEGSYAEPITVTKAMTIYAKDGTASIGP